MYPRGRNPAVLHIEAHKRPRQEDRTAVVKRPCFNTFSEYSSLGGCCFLETNTLFIGSVWFFGGPSFQFLFFECLYVYILSEC